MLMPVPVEYWPHIAAILVFLCVMLIWMLFARSRDQRELLIHKIQHSGLVTLDGLVDSVNTGSEESSKITVFLDQIGKRVMPNKIIEGTRIRFLKVGIRGEVIPAIFWESYRVKTSCVPRNFAIFCAALRFPIRSITIVFICLDE